MATANNNLDILTNQELSIQISLNGLSFCILSKDTNTITYRKRFELDQRQTPVLLLDEIKRIFSEEKELQADFKSVHVIYINELSTIVPRALFNKDNLADYLKFNTKILKTDFIAFDDITINDSVNIYVPYMNINNYLYERFGEFSYKHYATVLIEQILTLEKNAEDQKLYVHVHKHHFEIIVTNKGELILYNTFDYNTKEDFIYYILFTAEQLQLNPETIKLIFLGDINEEDACYKITFNYVRHIEFGVPNYNYNSVHFDRSSHIDFILNHSF